MFHLLFLKQAFFLECWPDQTKLLAVRHDWPPTKYWTAALGCTLTLVWLCRHQCSCRMFTPVWNGKDAHVVFTQGQFCTAFEREKLLESSPQFALPRCSWLHGLETVHQPPPSPATSYTNVRCGDSKANRQGRGGGQRQTNKLGENWCLAELFLYSPHFILSKSSRGFMSLLWGRKMLVKVVAWRCLPESQDFSGLKGERLLPRKQKQGEMSRRNLDLWLLLHSYKTEWKVGKCHSLGN